MFATEQEQEALIKSIEASMPQLTKFQKKQYELVVAHLKSDKSANCQVVLVPSSFGGPEAVGDQAKIFPPPASADQGGGLTVRAPSPSKQILY